MLFANHRPNGINMNKMNQPTPESISAGDLSYVERLLLHALRQWVSDRTRWPEVVLEFNRTCGPRAATRMCESLEAAFRTLGLHARRHVRLHPLLCCSVSQDELCVLNVIAAHESQSALHAKSLINWLVSPQAASALETEIDILPRSLYDAGYILNIRQQPTRHSDVAVQAIHAVH
jgi:hypothetical protein